MGLLDLAQLVEGLAGNTRFGANLYLACKLHEAKKEPVLPSQDESVSGLTSHPRHDHSSMACSCR